MTTQVTHRGADFNFDVTDYGQALISAGLTFVVRYICDPENPKFLTGLEKNHLNSLGILVAPVFEQGFPTTPGYFSEVAGTRDGQNASTWARRTNIGNSAILYVALDCDLTDAQIMSMGIPYLRAFKGACGRLRIRPYGSFATIKASVDSEVCDGGYLSGSTGWNGYQEGLGSPLVKILQTGIDNFQIPGTQLTGDGDHAFGESGAS